MHTLHLGFIALARSTFDTALAEQVTQTARSSLRAAGFELHGPDAAVSDLPGAESAVASLRDTPIDLLVIFQSTFADSTLATTLVEGSPAPVLLWAVPEERSGGRLRLNSLCGINLAAHALKLRVQRYWHQYLPAGDPAALARVRTLAQAGNIYRRLRRGRMGVVGQHPAGLDSCDLDPHALHTRLGLAVEQYPLEGLFQMARSRPEAETTALRSHLAQRVAGLDELEQAPLAGSLQVYSALKELAQRDQLDGLAVRCWPEFFTELGCAACGAMSMLSDGLSLHAPVPCSCEADANGTVTQMILGWLSGEPAFGSDLVNIDREDNSAVLWHCGLAPLSMADPQAQPRGGLHSNRKKPLVMEFPLKPGVVTLARLSQTGSGDQPFRLVVGRGEMLAAPPSFSGTSGVLRFERSAGDTLDTILDEGLEHHLSLTYGDYVEALLALAELLDLPVLRL